MFMATWNIQGLNTKKREVFQELEKLKVDICVLTETKKKGKGNEMIAEYIHFYSGVKKEERAKRGVSIAVHKKHRRNINCWEQIDERIMTVELTKHGREMVVIGVYAPTDDADKEVKDDFYGKLTGLLEKINPRKEKILLGDFNGRIGMATNSDSVGRYGEDTLNDNGERLINMCEALSLKILNGFFPHKWIHKYTWESPSRNLRSIIDYIIQHKNSSIRVNDVRVYRGPECGTDHFLLGAKMVIRPTIPMIMQENGNHTVTLDIVKYKLNSLKQEAVQFLYRQRLSNKLLDIEEGSTEHTYRQIKKYIHEAAYEALGLQGEGQERVPEWWSRSIEEKIKLKKMLYNNWLRTRDQEDRKLYIRMNREVKKDVCKRKNEMWERKCEEIDRCMGGTKVSEAWKTVKNVRKDVKSES